MQRKRNSNSSLVYSSDTGRTCPTCGKPIGDCRGHRNETAKGDGVVRVARETKGRKGKGVTVITGVPLGGELEYVDGGTLSHAFFGRRVVD